MPKSLIIKANCPTCGKIAVEESRVKLSGSILLRLKCGHVTFEHQLSSTDYSSIISSDGRSLMGYQVEGVKFAEESGANCLIADEQGLGKTIQSLAVLKLHQESLCPGLIVTKTTIKQQWMYELIRWTGNLKVQVIKSSKEVALPGMDFYVATYDILKSAENVFSLVEIKTLVLDECQAIKNHTSGRAKAVQSLKESHKIEHILALSGTPIKNHAGEYFTILNLLRPTQFPEYYGFLKRWCDYYDSYYGTKVGGLADPEAFHQYTKDFIIRRTKDEVLKDLPKLSRNFYHCSMDSKFGAAYKKAYNELLELMYEDDSFDTQANRLAIMNRMRQITGISKVVNCVDYVTDWMLSTDKPLVVFTHHDDVRTLLQHQLNEWMKDGDYPDILMLTSDLSADKRAEVVERFKNGGSRILVASTLAAGEGLNLQFCSDAIMLERQWNPANEEQAEARFHRYGQENPVTITYFIAAETIDQFFTELVEAKRAIVASALDGKAVDWNQPSLMKELAETIVRNGLKNWSM